ncbi:MAG: uroporphyrinogen decarboxylase family protein [Anaerolineales bacterium]|nr:MAG: uroporphyrinogen decarboxylase family protein [Anaerolineales bacterium]
MNSRIDILSLLNGNKLSEPPAFSGLIHVMEEGLASEGLTLREVHHDAGKMARAAVSTFESTGMPSATLPLDLCAPAEALGAELNYEGEGFPQVKKAVFDSVKELATENTENLRIGRIAVERLETGRLGIVCEAIRLVKGEVGSEVVISGMIPGPYTLLLYLCNPKNLFIEMKREPNAVLAALFHLSSFLARIGNAYREAGADFITIHDMGGSPGFIGPSKYEQFVLPAEKDLIERLPSPRVLSVCGNVSKSLGWLNQTGAEAISLDQTVNLNEARAALTDAMLFGNLDPVALLSKGEAAEVGEAVQRSKEAGVDAVWPGCDLVPSTPLGNIRAMIEGASHR